jgi:hypothetical protein
MTAGTCNIYLRTCVGEVPRVGQKRNADVTFSTLTAISVKIFYGNVYSDAISFFSSSSSFPNEFIPTLSEAVARDC